MKFSIVIPVYNVAPYFRECLDSVLAQTYADWEAVCVDDGATDGSGAILDEYASRCRQIKVAHQKNSGVASARNAALDAASGDWIVFLDGDDVLAPTLLADLQNVMGKYPSVDVISFNTAKFEDGCEYPWIGSHNEACSVCVKEKGRSWSIAEAYCGFWGNAYRRDVVGKVRFEDFRIGEDTLFLMNCLLRASCYVSINTLGYGYRMRKSSVSHEKVSKAICLAHPVLMSRFLKLADVNATLIGHDLLRLWVNNATETFNGMFRQLPKNEQREPWQCWRKAMRTWRHHANIKGFQHCRMMLFCMAPFRFMSWLLYYLPYKLKIMGVHR